MTLPTKPWYMSDREWDTATCEAERQAADRHFRRLFWLAGGFLGLLGISALVASVAFAVWLLR